MARGDILSVSINAGSANKNGVSALITIDDMVDGGSYDFGISENAGGNYNDPADAKIALTVTSQGYSASGVLGTITRTVYGVPDKHVGAMRLPYPDQASPDETEDSGNLIICVVLSEPIYNDDTVTAVIDAGWYTDDGSGGSSETSNAFSGSVTNNSTLDYPRVVGNWAWPGRSVVSDDFDIEFAAFHGFARDGKQVACVKFEAEDEHSHTWTETVTTMSLSTKSGTNNSPPNSIIVYKATVDVSGFTDGDNITVTARAYPWVGDADSVLETDDAVNTWPTPKYTDQIYEYRSGNAYFCVVDSGSSQAAADCYISQAAAEAAHTGNSNTAYSSIGNALTALQNHYNADGYENSAAGGTILVLNASTSLGTTNGGTLTKWVTIKPKTGVTQAQAIIQASGANAGFPKYLKVDGCTFFDSSFYLGSSTSP